MNKKYKYYIFYINTKEEYVCNLLENDNLPIYAYTDNSDLALKFKIQRNMKYFIYKKCSLTRDEVRMLATEIPRSILINKNGISKDPYTYADIPYDIVCTYIEEVSCNHMCWNAIYQKVWDCIYFDPMIINDRFRKSLECIYYIKHYNQVHQDVKDIETDIFHFIKPDFLAAFVKNYGFLLRE